MKGTATILGVILFCGSAIAAAPVGNMTLSVEGGRQAPVTFSHNNHNMTCKDCHHEGEENQKCQECHSDLKARKGEKSFYAAFHSRDSIHSCVGCHKQENIGPTKCSECHKK